MKRLPSFGLLLMCATFLGTIFFFNWALAEPPLQRLLHLQRELRTGERWKLSEEDRKLLTTHLRQYPELPSSLLDGRSMGILSANQDGWVETPHVTLIRHAKALEGARMELHAETPTAHLPMTVTMAGDGWQQNFTVTERGMTEVELPAVARAELIHMHFKSESLKGKELRADPSALAIRLLFKTQAATVHAEVQP